jgi:hypothetical protein
MGLSQTGFDKWVTTAPEERKSWAAWNIARADGPESVNHNEMIFRIE